MNKDERKESVNRRSDLHPVQVGARFETHGPCDNCASNGGVLRGDWQVICDQCAPSVYPDTIKQHTP